MLAPGMTQIGCVIDVLERLTAGQMSMTGARRALIQAGGLDRAQAVALVRCARQDEGQGAA